MSNEIPKDKIISTTADNMKSTICDPESNAVKPEIDAMLSSGAAKSNNNPANIFIRFLPVITVYNPSPSIIADTTRK